MKDVENKPLILIMEDAKKDFVDNINITIKKYNLPMYFVEILFNDIYRNMIDTKNEEIRQATISYYHGKPIEGFENVDNSIEANDKLEDTKKVEA